MRLLIITQTVDSTHPILGFFHRWIEEFAKECTHVHVICLEAGRHSLPANVTVHSLGKEAGKSRLQYLVRFYTLIWQLRHEYNSVFVHMNQLYVVLGAPFWRALKKPVGLWYAHGSSSTSLRVAEKMAEHIFTCSRDSFPLESKKVYVTGHGIDLARFAPQTVPKDLDLITVGRLTESKNPTTLIELLAELRTMHPVTLTIVGKAVTEAERQYEARLHEMVRQRDLLEAVNFIGAVAQTELPQYLSRAKVFVTVAQNGSLDKAMLEAMACGLPIVSMAPGSASLPLGAAQTSTKEAFMTELKKVLESGVFTKPEYVEYVQREHSLTTLIPKITTHLS